MDIDNQGTDNNIEVAPGIPGTLIVRGNGNRISIEKPLAANHVQVNVGSNNTIRVGANCVIGHLIVYCNDGATVTLGSHVGMNGPLWLYAHEAKKIEIRDGCLFAANTIVTVSDMHSLVDVASGTRINPPRDVLIEERVWVGERCYVMKGAHVGSGRSSERAPSSPKASRATRWQPACQLPCDGPA